jgi:hypothetical protein
LRSYGGVCGTRSRKGMSAKSLLQQPVCSLGFCFKLLHLFLVAPAEVLYVEVGFLLILVEGFLKVLAGIAKLSAEVPHLVCKLRSVGLGMLQLS